jgi:5-methylcytosine-specific restriction endonuclease McrA
MVIIFDKTCSKCRRSKCVDEFHRNRSAPDGRHQYCKPCKKVADRSTYERNLVERRKKMLVWHEENRDEHLQKMSQYGRVRRVLLGDVERERVNAAQRANPDGHRNRQARRRARKRNAHVEHVHPLVLLELHDGVCGICGGDVDPMNFHVDHIEPLALGGDHSYDNTQPAHPSCNQRKGAREI